jgi:cytochrome P450
MLRNEEDYPNPDAFEPERFLKDGRLNLAIREPSTMAFGFGRRYGPYGLAYSIFNLYSDEIFRECPGKSMALATLWLTTASILSAFEITKALDENGKPIEAEIKYSSSLVVYVVL